MRDTDGTCLRTLSRNYVREPQVVADIVALRAQPPSEFWRRAAITDFREADCPRLESLVYCLREFQRRGESTEAWRIIEVLERRIAGTITRYLARLYLSADQREEITDDLVTTLYAEWLSDAPAHEFWEVRFQVCLKRKMIDVATRHRRIATAEVSLSRPESEAEGLSDPLEQMPDPTARDPQTAAIVLAALDSLPEPLRSAFYLYHAEQWTEESIARHLGVTSRSVRNYLRRAEQRLAEWHEQIRA